MLLKFSCFSVFKTNVSTASVKSNGVLSHNAGAECSDSDEYAVDEFLQLKLSVVINDNSIPFGILPEIKIIIWVSL